MTGLLLIVDIENIIKGESPILIEMPSNSFRKGIPVKLSDPI